MRGKRPVTKITAQQLEMLSSLMDEQDVRYLELIRLNCLRLQTSHRQGSRCAGRKGEIDRKMEARSSWSHNE